MFDSSNDVNVSILTAYYNREYRSIQITCRDKSFYSHSRIVMNIKFPRRFPDLDMPEHTWQQEGESPVSYCRILIISVSHS